MQFTLWSALSSVMLLMLQFVVPTADALYSESSSVVIATTTPSFGLLQRAVLAYKLISSTNVTVQLVLSDAVIKAQMQQNVFDLGFVMNGLTRTDQTLYPDTISYPVLATGIAPIYNLPGMPAGFVLTMSMTVLARIYTANITWWNDTQIMNENPGYTMPGNQITMVLKNYSASAYIVFVSALAPYDSVFPSMFPISGPIYPYSSYAKYIGSIDFYATSLAVVTTPYSVSNTQSESATPMAASMANMLNKAGKSVPISSNSIAVAATERSVASNAYTYSDCSSASSSYAYPLCGYVSVVYSQSTARTTCAAKLEALAFIQYFISSKTVAALTTTLSILPVIVASTAKFLPITMTCNGTPVIVGVASVLQLAGTPAISGYLKPALSYYTTVVDTSESSQFVINNGRLAINQVLKGEIDVAVVLTEQIAAQYPDVWNSFITSGDLRILPYAAVSVAAIFCLPAGIATMVCTTCVYPLWGATTSRSERLLNDADLNRGLVLDASTLALIYSARIISWNDPLVLQYNPWLAERLLFAASNSININTAISLVVSTDTVSTALQVMAFGMNATIPVLVGYGIANTSAVKLMGNWASPFQFNVADLKSRNPNVLVFPNEQQLGEATLTVPGAFSYSMSSTATSSMTTDVRMLWYNNQSLAFNFSDTKTYAISTPGIKNCAANFLPYNSNSSSNNLVDVNSYSLNLASSQQQQNAWSWSSLVSFVVLSHYRTTDGFDMTHSNKTLNMLEWLMQTQQLSAASNFSGVARVADTTWANASLTALQLITCDNMTCLITLPVTWSINSSVMGFGVAVGVIGLLSCVIVTAIVIKFRKSPVIRSASVTFQLIILFGLMTLFAACFALVANVSSSSCMALGWLVNFGFELAFLPLILKMYRIHKIFSRKQLRVVKLSDARLLAYGAVFVCVDAILLTIWSADSTLMLQPLLTNISIGVNSTRYTQCGVPTAGIVFPVLLGVEKALFLLFGVGISFSTRKVSSTFNESSSVAWCVYQTVLATVICIPIIVFTSSIGDTLIIMMLILLLWSAMSVLIMLFGQKIHGLFKADLVQQMSQLDQTRTFTGGFSFVSVDNLTHATVDNYLAALEKHTIMVKQKKSKLQGATVAATGRERNEGGQIDKMMTTTSNIPTHNHAMNVRSSSESMSIRPTYEATVSTIAASSYAPLLQQ